MKKVQRMLNFHTYKRLFCANCDVIAKVFASLKKCVRKQRPLFACKMTICKQKGTDISLFVSK